MDDIIKAEMPKVEVIKATKRSVRNPDIVSGRKLRVAAYCRVSTDDEEQQNSYIQQKEYYTNLILKNPDWELVDIYADEGISGTSTKNRKEFQRMAQDAEDGKIDLILTKSISRFARNTIDTLSWVQKLRNLPNPVQVNFEKEGFESFDFSSEMLLTIMSAFAQAESRSISDNVKWSIQKNFANGKPTINLNRMLGYDMGENGKWIINEEQATIVREIYNMYICGVSAHRIAKIFNEKGTHTVNGKNWTAKAVLTVLRNEKYVGDLLMQKTITTDMLNHIVIKNSGIAKQYYVKDHHAPIITRELWDKVQVMLEHNTVEKQRIKSKDRFAVLSNLYCGVCGKPYFRQRYSSKVASLCTDDFICKFGYPLLKCAANCKTDSSIPKLKVGEKRCNSDFLHECAVYQSFMEKLYQIKADILKNKDKAELVKSYHSLCLARSKEESSILYRDYCDVIDQIDKMRISINSFTENQTKISAILGDNEMFMSIISEYKEQLSELKKHKDALLTKIIRSAPDAKQFEYFIECILALPDVDESEKMLLPFDKAFYLTFIDKGIVYKNLVEYTTKFGVTFCTTGNNRKMTDFIGYIYQDKKGNFVAAEYSYQVVGTKLQYIKK